MDWIPIGRFSKMTRLSIKALRLYDEIGLLEPAHVDPSSGYRYYELAQANRAEAVRILRSVDMPLAEIQAVLADTDPSSARATLLAHRDRLAARLANQERMLTYLESIIQREGIMPYDVAIAETAPQQIAAVKVHTTLSQIADDIGAGFGAIMHAVGRGGLTPAGAPLLVFHDIIDEETAGHVEICIPIIGALDHTDTVYDRELEGGTMATTMHQGPYEQITPAYHTLAGWIEQNGYEIAGPPREIYLNDPQTVPPEELLTRVEYPVCPVAG